MVSVHRLVGAAAGVLLAAATATAQAPPAPTNLVATATAPGQVTLAWSPSAGATSYNVYRSDEQVLEYEVGSFTWRISPRAVVAGTVSGTSFVDSGLPALVRYWYYVTALTGSDESAVTTSGAYGVVMTAAAPNAPIFGIADLHTHQFANLGFGGKMFWGKPYAEATTDPDKSALENALGWCTPAHGPGGVLDLVGDVLGETVGHLVGGYPQFDGWPRWNTYTHQQMYIDWLERAFLGGLKLIVVHAVNNEVLCGAPGQPQCDDMASADAQIEAALDLERHVPWYRVAHSSAEARQIINSGKLAVVLGIEVDDLFDCRKTGSCTPDVLKADLKKYYDAGVRHIFPIHAFNNAYGGAALYNDVFNLGNMVMTGSLFVPRECGGPQYSYQVAGVSPIVAAAALLFGGIPLPIASGNAADCNVVGLSGLGESLVTKIMSRKMLLDVDHMSASAFARTLDLGSPFTYPLVSGHAGFIDTSNGGKRSEAQKTSSQVDAIRDNGGLIGVILHQGSKDEIAAFGTKIPNDCSNSTKTWAQAYLYAVSKMNGGAVAIGSDFNGLAGQPGPRFSGEGKDDACHGDDPRVPQSGGVTYPFAPFGQTGRIGKSTAGVRAFNFNFDGLAHIGMLPDFIEDLRSLGLTATDLNPLFSSAEAYIQMWANAESKNINPPSISVVRTPAANAAGWNNGNVTLSATATENPDGWAVDHIDYSATGAQATGQTQIAGASALLTVTTEGTTVFSVSASDEAHNASAPWTATVSVDKTAPVVSCASADLLWHATDVSLGCTATDAVSGLANAADATFSLTTSLPAGSENTNVSTNDRSVRDLAGNGATAGPIGGNKIDKKPPSITIGVPVAGTYIINQVVPASYGCVDGGSGLASCAGPVATGASLATSSVGVHNFTVNATDNVGNPSAQTIAYTVTYNVCLLYDPNKAKSSGSTFPIKLQVCDANNANVSLPGIVLTATGVNLVSTSAPGILDDAGNANPENNFRFDSTLGGTGGYIFNLNTSGLSTGTYAVSFVATGDPTTHAVRFQVK